MVLRDVDFRHTFSINSDELQHAVAPSNAIRIEIIFFLRTHEWQIPLHEHIFNFFSFASHSSSLYVVTYRDRQSLRVR